MGITTRIIEVLDHAVQNGADFTRTAMIGRQQVHLTAKQFADSIADCGFLKERDTTKRQREVQDLVEQVYDCNDKYAEPLLRAMGAEVVDSVDNSEYENANIVIDLNTPIKSDLKQRYTMVIDGGSLEHVFNFPVAIRNCMEMLDVGGTFFTINGTNNACGHGFYQFSPELMYRVLSPENGFQVEEMLVYERFDGSQLYRVKDPKQVRSRVMPHTKCETFLNVIATRTAVTEIFAKAPQQSDYSVDWARGEHREPTLSWEDQPPIKRLGKTFEKKLRFVRRQLFSRYRSEHFEKFDSKKVA